MTFAQRTANSQTTRAPAAAQSTLPISVAIIAQDEAKQLPSLVASLFFAREIIVVDGGSSDGTAVLARELGCRVTLRTFDNFAAQRNHAIDLCRQRWVLSIDADERPSPAVARELRTITKAVKPAEVAFRIPIRSRIFGRRMRFSGTQDDRPVRLFLRGAARWSGDVHERLHVQGRVGQTRGCLEHTTLPDLRHFLAKMDRYTTLEAKRRLKSALRPRWRDRWIAPVWEILRRFVYKGGFLDGPQGWAFCALSGLSKWVEADKHRRAWQTVHTLWDKQRDCLADNDPAAPLSIARPHLEDPSGRKDGSRIRDENVGIESALNRPEIRQAVAQIWEANVHK